MLEFVEVTIEGDQMAPTLEGSGSDPYVVDWNWVARLLQPGKQLSIAASSFRCRGKYGDERLRQEISQGDSILPQTPSHLKTGFQLAQHCDREKHDLGGCDQTDHQGVAAP
jgi:hypothetical protein